MRDESDQVQLPLKPRLFVDSSISNELSTPPVRSGVIIGEVRAETRPEDYAHLSRATAQSRSSRSAPCA